MKRSEYAGCVLLGPLARDPSDHSIPKNCPLKNGEIVDKCLFPDLSGRETCGQRFTDGGSSFQKRSDRTIKQRSIRRTKKLCAMMCPLGSNKEDNQ